MNALEDLRFPNDTTIIAGIEYKFTFESDENSFENISDHGDVYGETRWVRDSDYGPERPSDFTGRARIITRDHGSTLWWEPYWDGDYPDGGRGETFDADAEYRNVCEIMEWGFYVAGLESSDGYVAYLGGIEPNPDASYVLDVVTDLFAELEHDRTRDRNRRLVVGANRWLGTRLPVPA